MAIGPNAAAVTRVRNTNTNITPTTISKSSARWQMSPSALGRLLVLFLATGRLIYAPSVCGLVNSQSSTPSPSAVALAARRDTNTSDHLLFTTYNDIRVANIARRPNAPAASPAAAAAAAASAGVSPAAAVVASAPSPPVTVDVLIKDLVEGSALDIDHARQLVCWTDQGLESIECQPTHPTATSAGGGGAAAAAAAAPHKFTVVSSGLGKPEGLAIDWYTGNVYWTDGETDRIEVAQLEASAGAARGYRKVLFWSDLDQPRAIALVPHRRLMLWSDWGETPKIERASMDGDAGSRTVLVRENIFWPNGLAVDLAAELVYWVDGHYQFLDVMRLDGSERRTVVRNVPYPYSVTKLAHTLYWTNWHVGSIQSFDLLTNETHELIDTVEGPLAVHAWDARLQPPPLQPPPCAHANGNCSHLCLLSAVAAAGYTCACPTGVALLDAWRCADGPQEQLFVVQRTQISRISLDTPDHSAFALQLDRVKYAIAIDYDPVDGFVYWSDEEAHAIRRARPDGSAQSDIVTLEVAHPDGIAIDWQARNLYWTDTGTDRIEVCRLDGSARRAVVNEHLDEPRAIALAPARGWMFWSDWSERNPKVERAAMDGSGRTVLVSEGLGWPNGIAVDETAAQIYWCDARTDRIEVIGMEGGGRRVLLNHNLPHVFGLSLLGEYVYWTDWQRRSIDRANKNTGADRTVVVDQFPDLMGLKVTRTHERTVGDASTVPGVRNACALRNGECSHLCLNRPGGDYVCTCPIDRELAADRRQCVVPRAFLLFSKLDSIGTISLEFNEGNRNDYKIPFRELRDAHRQLDVDTAARRIYFTDQKARCIWRAHINGSGVERIVDAGLVRPEGVAVDWLAGNLFWADSEARRIEVARLSGHSRRVLLWRGIEEPRGLIVEPAAGLLYWSEWPSDSIRRAQMDGADVVTVVAGANHATGLTQDAETRRLYWASQSRPKAIESVGWDGRGRATIVSDAVDEPYAVAVWGRWVYWGDWNTGDVERVDKRTGDERQLVHDNLEYASALVVFEAERREQNGTLNAGGCAVRNGGCAHLCLTVPQSAAAAAATASAASSAKPRPGWTCACPTHHALGKDGVSCVAPRHFLLISQRSSFGRLLPNASDAAPDAPLPMPAKNVRAVDYDPVQHQIWWIEGGSAGGRATVIRRAADNEARVSETVVAVASAQPFDLAVDYVGRHLYWTCALANAINVTSLNGDVIGNVDAGGTDLERPRAIAVHSMRRLVVWTDVGLQAVWRARMDGAERRQLAGKLDGVTAMTVDTHLDLVFVAHGKCIEMMGLDGLNRQVLVGTHISQVVALAALHSFVYWLDERTERTGVERIAITGDGRKPEVQRLRNITDIAAVWTPDGRQLRNHSCTVQRAKCSHLCVLAAPTVAQCACPPGLSLLDDGHNCGAPPICGPDHFTCSASDGGAQLHSQRSAATAAAAAALGTSGGGGHSGDLSKDCIPVSWRCDGQNDCADRSDEMGCPKCQADQFRCQSGECIDRQFVCDGTTNCADGYDEADCCKSVLDFQCPINRVCIPAGLLCDGWDHCADGADEAPETCLATMHGGRKGVGGGGGGLAGGAGGVDGTGTVVPGSDKETFIVVSVVLMVAIFAAVYVVNTRLNGCKGGGLEPKDDPAADPLAPNGEGAAGKQMARVMKLNSAVAGVNASAASAAAESMRMTSVRRGPVGNVGTMGHGGVHGGAHGGHAGHGGGHSGGGGGGGGVGAGSVANSYDRNHITGASSSTTSHSFGGGYPLNPPPSPATTTASTQRYGGSSAYWPNRNQYRTSGGGGGGGGGSGSGSASGMMMGQQHPPPPPSPCSTDVCDESDSPYSPAIKGPMMMGAGGSFSRAAGGGSGLMKTHPNPYHHQQQHHQQQHHHHHHHHHHNQHHAPSSAASAYSLLQAAPTSSPTNTSDQLMDRSDPFPPPPTPGSSHYHSDFGGEYHSSGGGGGGGHSHHHHHNHHRQQQQHQHSGGSRASNSGGGGGAAGGGGHDNSSCPPSPGSRSSTYFSPLPPPPSPVPMTTGPSSRAGSGSGYS